MFLDPLKKCHRLFFYSLITKKHSIKKWEVPSHLALIPLNCGTAR
jgi:hypothetical protein